MSEHVFCITSDMLRVFFFSSILFCFGAKAQLQCNHFLDSSQKNEFSLKIEQLYSSQDAEALSSNLSKKFKDYLVAYEGENLPKDLFSIYLDHRLALLSPEMQAFVRSWIEDRVQFVSKDRIGGKLDYVRDKIKLILPEEFISSLVATYIMVHEVEHLIQTRIVGIGSGTYFHPYHYTVHRFNLEKGAIRAEGAFLLSLPESLLKSELDKIRETVNRKKIKRATFLINAFQNAIDSNNVDTYLNKTWEQGRYSYNSLLWAHIIEFGLFPGTAPFIIGLAHYMGW